LVLEDVLVDLLQAYHAYDAPNIALYLCKTKCICLVNFTSCWHRNKEKWQKYYFNYYFCLLCCRL